MADTSIYRQGNGVSENTTKGIVPFTAKRSERTSLKAKRSLRTSLKAKPRVKKSPKARTSGKRSPRAKPSVRALHKGKKNVRISPKEKAKFRTSQKVLTEQFRYSYKAFPRCNILLQSVPILSGYYSKFINVNVIHATDYKVYRNDFAVEKDVKEQAIHLSCVTRSCSLPYVHVVNVCILQCGKDGSLTSTDKSILQCVRKNKIGDSVLFVIDEKLSDKQFVIASEEIGESLGLGKSFNDVLHRLFPRQTDDIGIRISLLFDELLLAEIESAHKVNTARVKKLNDTDLQYHQLKYVSLRNELICEFGHRKGQLFVSIKEINKKNEVNEYLQKLLPNARNIEIIPFKEMVLKPLLLKSGDTVGNSIDIFVGTVGLLLEDGPRHFCSTCKHVVSQSLTPEHSIVVDDHEYQCDSVIIRSEGTSFKTDCIVTSPEEIDFAVVRLARRNLPISVGLRSQFSGFVNGKIWGIDRLILLPETPVYKWGAISSLTNGTYVGRSDGRNRPPLFEFKGDGNDVFAEPGDSGSLICYPEIETGFEIAACVVTASSEDMTVIYGYKLAEAMQQCKKILPNIKECIYLERR